MTEAANDPVALAKRQAVTADKPNNGDNRHESKALHHGSEYVFTIDEPPVKQGQSRPGHKQNEGTTDKHPCIVSRALSRCDRVFESLQTIVLGTGLSVA